MDLKQIINLSGINFWYLASALGLNAIWTYVILFVILRTIEPGTTSISALQIQLLLSTFIGTFVVGFLIGKIAGDLRGPTYGVVGSMSSVGLLVFTLLQSGGSLGILAVITALAGGLNGGLLTLPRRKPPSRS